MKFPVEVSTGRTMMGESLAPSPATVCRAQIQTEPAGTDQSKNCRPANIDFPFEYDHPQYLRQHLRQDAMDDHLRPSFSCWRFSAAR